MDIRHILVDSITYDLYDARIDDIDSLSFVNPEEGEEVIIDDPGTTGTVLWGSESANQVSLSVNGVSKLLLKPAAIDGITSRLGLLEGYFSNGVARNAALLNGHEESYFATAASVTAESIASSLTNAGYKLTDTIYTLPTASADTLGGIKIGTGLTINDGVVSVTGQTQGTVTRVDVGSTPYNPNTNGVVSLPAYPTTLPASDVSAWAKASSLAVDSVPSLPWSKITSGIPTTLEGYGITDAKFSSAGVSDKIRITLGSNYHDVLTAHQSLSGYATESWVGQQGFITKAVNDLTNYYLKSDTYTKTEVEDLIAAINQFHYEIAASISDVLDPQSNVLYLIGPSGSGSDRYEEYVYTTTWVKIGDTSIDLSGYVNDISASGIGNYVSAISKNGNRLTVSYGTLPTTIALSNVTGADDLKAIEALTGTSGLLRKTAENTWGLDTSAYITGIDSEMIENALGYTPMDEQSIYFGAAGTDSRPLTVGSTTVNYLTAHQSLQNYVTLNTQQQISGDKTFQGYIVFSNENQVEFYGGLSADDDSYFGASLGVGGNLLVDGGALIINNVGTSSKISLENDSALTPIDITWSSDDITSFPDTERGIYIDGGISSQDRIYTTGDLVSDAAIVGNRIIKNGGTATQFLKADGSVDSNSYALASSLSNYVTNTALANWIGSQNINTLGTVTTGVWHGSAITQDYLDDIGWTLVRNAATYDTEDYIHVNS